MKNTNFTTEDISVLAWLSSVKNFNGKLGLHFLENADSPVDLLRIPDKTLSAMLPPAAFKAFTNHKNSSTPEMVAKKISDAGARFVSYFDSDYPKRLKDIPDAPLGLFVIGSLPSDSVPSVAIIGARSCSEYGKYVASEVGHYLGSHEIQVISGMAYGIDGIGQNAALEAGGTSMAVLGSGVDICYPSANKFLYEKLIKNGGIISTYGMGEPAIAGNFPPRNRIVSGLADALIVVEARQKSGTIITVDMALEQGREVYAVPGRITDRLSDGCNGLIGQGAQVFLSPEIFVDELLRNMENRSFGQNSERKCDTGKRSEASASGTSLHRHFDGKEHIPAGLSPEAEKIYLALDLLPQNVETICGKLNGSKQQNKSVSANLTSDGVDSADPTDSANSADSAHPADSADQADSADSASGSACSQYTYTEVSMILMQLMLDNHAQQVSPGCFVKVLH